MLEEIQQKVKTGTTTVGIVAKDGIVLAAERKATMGYLVASQDAQKIYEIDDRLGMTIAGMVGDAQALIRYIRAELKLYRLQEEKPIELEAASTLIANILYSRRFYPYIVQLVVAGYDSKPSLFTLSPDGSVMPEKFFSTGSGSPIAFGVLENDFKDGMSIDEAKKVAVRAVRAATKRDIASGGSGIDAVVINKSGFKRLGEDEVKKLAG
ncbi:MAG: archaeal proteasome endopeptidase complex subunit beta [Candidatus Aenigmarchaeota archaeon]|nr:archaeal proteasome endopeptidase complex subunit beta [Candidatus Aenigmarchaeota archaeon]